MLSRGFTAMTTNGTPIFCLERDSMAYCLFLRSASSTIREYVRISARNSFFVILCINPLHTSWDDYLQIAWNKCKCYVSFLTGTPAVSPAYINIHRETQR